MIIPSTHLLILVLFLNSLSYSTSALAETEKHHEQALHNNAILRLAFKNGLSTSNLSVCTHKHIDASMVGIAAQSAIGVHRVDRYILYKD